MVATNFFVADSFGDEFCLFGDEKNSSLYTIFVVVRAEFVAETYTPPELQIFIPSGVESYVP